MTKLVDIKKRLMARPEFREQYEQSVLESPNEGLLSGPPMTSLGDRLAAASGLDDPAHIRRLTSPKAMELGAYGLHSHDLFSAARALDELIKDGSEHVERRGVSGSHEILWCGLVITYCRCFDGRARAPYHLVPDQVFADDPVGCECHQWLWNERNKYHAHDVNDRRFSAIAVVLTEDASDYYFQALTAVVSDTAASYRTVRQLILHVSRFVEREVERLNAEIGLELEALSPSARLALDPLSVNLAGSEATKKRP